VSDQHVLPVEKENVKFLDLAVRDLRGAIIDQLVPGIDDRPLFQFRAQRPQPRLARRFERGNAGRTQPGAGERVRLGAKQFRKAAEPLEQILGDGLDIGARVAGEQDHLEQLVIRQIVCASLDQPFAQAFPVPVVMRRSVGPLGKTQPSGAALCVHRTDQPARRRARSSASAAPAMRAGSSVS
jgi:hypothetical protein